MNYDNGLIQEAVTAAAREYNATLERMCKKALTDPLGRGVEVVWSEGAIDFDAVDQHFSAIQTIIMRLSADVPHGEIHIYGSGKDES